MGIGNGFEDQGKLPRKGNLIHVHDVFEGQSCSDSLESNLPNHEKARSRACRKFPNIEHLCAIDSNKPGKRSLTSGFSKKERLKPNC